MARHPRSLALAIVVLVVGASAVGCVPQTTVRAQNEPVKVAPNAATLVLVYPPVADEGAPAMPLLQRNGRGVWFRFTVGTAQPIADLDAGKYSVVRLPPGAHTIVAAAWACTVGDCGVAVLDALVAPNKLYVVRLGFKPQVTLEPIVGYDLTALSRYQRLSLDPFRESHWILDSGSRRQIVADGVSAIRQSGRRTFLAD